MRTDQRHDQAPLRAAPRSEPGSSIQLVGARLDSIEAAVALHDSSEAADSSRPFSLDSEIVQQANARIHHTMAEISRASKSDWDLAPFLRYVLPRIRQAMGADGAAIWVWSEEEHWEVITHDQLPSPLWAKSSSHEAGANVTDKASARSHQFRERLIPSVEHLSILEEIRREKQPMLVPPQEVQLSSSRPTNPTSSQLIFSPIPARDSNHEYWLQVAQPASGGLASQRGYLRFSCQMAEYIGEFLREFQSRRVRSNHFFLEQIQNWLDSSSLDRVQAVPQALELVRDFAKSDHAILLQRAHVKGKWSVFAVAGLRKIDRSSDAIKITEAAAIALDRVAQGRSDLSLNTQECEESAFPIELSINPLKDDSKLRALTETLKCSEIGWYKPMASSKGTLQPSESILASLKNTSRSNSPTDFVKPSEDNVALLLAWNETPTSVQGSVPSCLTLVRLASTMPIQGGKRMQGVGAQGSLPFEKPRLIRMAGYFVLAASLLAVLAFPVPMQIESMAILVPKSAKELFAPSEGIVSQVLVKHGQSVRAGETCVLIESPKLQAELENALAGHVKSRQRHADIEGKLLRDRSITPAERDTLESERDALRQVLDLERSSIALLERQIDQLSLRSPVPGIVETWNVDDVLKDRPVRTGQWLLSIREDRQGWELEGEIPEMKLEELITATEKPFNGFARLVSAPKVPIPLALDLEQTWRSSRSANHGQELQKTKPSLRIRFQIAGPIPADLAVSGANARIAVHTGNGPLVWALTKDFVEEFILRARMWYP